MIDINQTIRNTAIHYGVDYDCILGKCRKYKSVSARAYVANSLRKDKLTLKEIGEVLGGRDHSTIINLIKKYHQGVYIRIEETKRKEIINYTYEWDFKYKICHTQ